MDNKKVQAVQEWPCSSRVKQVQKFLRLANYYWRFIQGFGAIAKPLHKLTKKDQQFKWEPWHKATFEQFKQSFIKASVLNFPDSNKELQVECDASDFVTGAVLSTKGEDGLWHPCAFISHGLTEAEHNYPIYNKELLEIFHTFKDWHHYLLSNHKAIVV